MKQLQLVPDVLFQEFPEATIQHARHRLSVAGFTVETDDPVVLRDGRIESTEHSPIDLRQQGMVALLFETRETQDGQLHNPV
jgi:hypothetical protein